MSEPSYLSGSVDETDSWGVDYVLALATVSDRMVASGLLGAKLLRDETPSIETRVEVARANDPDPPVARRDERTIGDRHHRHGGRAKRRRSHGR